ncbi:S8 family serine peptidase [Halovenus marina]|uniref:S8 family serine peptidase n=1 Tax=Halovenus marina TaxID=3396621 RepID=UPI003F57DD2E
MALSAGSGVAAAENTTAETTIASELTEKTGEVELLVSFTAAPDNATVDQLRTHAAETQAAFLTYANRTDGITVERQFWIENAVLVTADTDRVSLTDIASVTAVERLLPNAKLTTAEPTGVSTEGTTSTARPQSTAESTPTTYGIDQINATGVWEHYDTQGEDIRVAVLDTGIDADHPDLDIYTDDASDPTYPGGWAEFDRNGNRVPGSEPHDIGTHGTHVSGTVAGGNASGTQIGVAPDAELMHGQVFSDDKKAYFAAILSGMEWAIENDADVISMSLGAEGYGSAFIDPIQNAQANGVTVVAAIGNDGAGTSSSPGNVYDVLSVGASDSTGNIAQFSSGEEILTDWDWGSAPAEWPDEYVVPSVSAPGSAVLSSVPGGSWSESHGTSMAAPHVSGAVALIQSATPRTHSPQDIADALEATASKPDGSAVPPGERDTRYGSGIIDVFSAIAWLEQKDPDLSDPSFSVTETALSETTVLENATINVIGTLTNEGDTEATHTVTLTVDGTPEQQQTYTLASGESELVSFELSISDRGEYAIALDGVSAGTLTVEQPATFEVTNATVEPTEIVAGETATTTATVTNVGDRAGTYEGTIDVDGLAVGRTTETIAAGETAHISVARTYSDPGTYAVGFDGVRAGNLTVLEPANITIAETTLDKSVINKTEHATVSVTLENTGEATGAFVTNLTVDGETTASQTVSVPGDSVEQVTFEPDFETFGSYEVGVNDRPVGDVFVRDPVTFSVTNTTLSHATAVPDETVTVTATVENNENRSGTVSPDLTVNNGSRTSIHRGIEPNGTVTVTFERTFDGAGEYDIAVEDLAVGTVAVPEPVARTVGETSVTPTTARTGEPVIVNGRVTNTDSRSGWTNVSLSVDGQSVDTQIVSLAANETATVSFEYVFAENGTYVVQVGSGESASVTVEDAPSLGNYQNEDGTVTTGHLRAAIDDWRTDVIGTGLLREVIRAWRG